MHSEATSILHETLGAIREILGSELHGITVERAVVGLFFTGSRAQQRNCRCLRDADQDDPRGGGCPSSAMAMPFRQIARPAGSRPRA
jgi:hypothetical protein